MLLEVRMKEGNGGLMGSSLLIFAEGQRLCFVNDENHIPEQISTILSLLAAM